MKTEKEPRLPSVWEPVFALAVLVAVLAALMAKNAGYLCRVFAVVALALVLGGCKSTVPGRFTTFDWDSRSPEQIAASVPADTAVYQRTSVEKPADTSPRFAEWVALAKVISEFRVRIRLGALEWGSDTRPVTEGGAK